MYGQINSDSLTVLLDKLAMNIEQQLILNGNQCISVKQHFDSTEDASLPSA
jgi:hypothetical protein